MASTPRCGRGDPSSILGEGKFFISFFFPSTHMQLRDIVVIKSMIWVNNVMVEHIVLLVCVILDIR
jgi:hypothetical protein